MDVSYIITVFAISLHVSDSRYCKPEFEFRDENGLCQDCPACKNGEESKVQHLHIDRQYGALDCYECTPCPFGKYSNDEYRIGNRITCVEWMNCTVLGRDYEIYPNSKTKGHCQRNCSKPGYYPSVRYMDDSPCFKCTMDKEHESECVGYEVSTKVTKLIQDDVENTPGVAVIVLSVLGGIILIALIIVIVYLCRKPSQISTPTSTATSSGTSIDLKESKALIKNNGGREARTIDPLEVYQLSVADPDDLVPFPAQCTEQESKHPEYELNKTEADWCKKQKVKNHPSIVSLICARSIISMCNEKFYKELLPTRLDAILKTCQIFADENLDEQCYRVIIKWQQIQGDGATLFELYMAVFNTYHVGQLDESSEKLYKQLLVELKDKIADNISEDTIVDMDTPAAES